MKNENKRAVGVMAALATGVLTLIALLSGNTIIAMLPALAFAASLFWIRHSNQVIRGTSTAPAQATSQSSATTPAASSRSTHANKNMIDIHEQTMLTMANNRRSAERGQKMQLQVENLELLQKNRDLQAEVQRLNKQVGDLTNALEDPFYDPPAPAQNVGT